MRNERRHYDIGIRALDAALIAGGDRASMARVLINAAGNCENPVGFERVYRRREEDTIGLQTTKERSVNTLILSGDGRCRRCLSCRSFRAAHWRFRALEELRQAKRTWMGTLTLCPALRTKILAEARLANHRSGVDYDTLPANTQFREQCTLLGERLTRYIKRVRRATDAQLRYLFVYERSQDGSPHLHCLLHECSNVSVPRETLAFQWQNLGFTWWKLVVDNGGAFYVTKYLTKETEVTPRIRASQRYGRDRGGILPEMDRSIRRALRRTTSGQAATASPTASAIAPQGRENFDRPKHPAPPPRAEEAAAGVMGTAHPLGGTERG